MSRTRHLYFHVATVAAALGVATAGAWAAQVGPVTAFAFGTGAAPRTRPAALVAGQSGLGAKPSPGVPAAAAASTTPAPTAAPSLLQEPAAPAIIELSGNLLSVTATNSSLSQVLRQVAERTGMQIEGDSRDERVFGVYGPGSPAEVLTSLLYDSGYNVLMVGRTDDGAPRKLVLSSRSSAPASAASAQPRRPSDEDEDDTPVEALQPPQPPTPMPMQQIGPRSTPGQVQTPQQMLEQLQRMSQQNLQNQQGGAPQ